ncbi:MAG: GNAT family N-acetyltransferase [Anaerolineales bacterium]
MRAIQPGDAPLLQAEFEKLSPETIYLRFLKSFKKLSDEQAEYFANVDYHDRMALVGTIKEEEGESVIAVARYDVIRATHTRDAECAIVVRDDYQNRGLGTAIMIRLTRYARQHGITAFVATIHISNTRIINFVRKSGLSFQRKLLEPGIWEFRVNLAEIYF